MKYHETLNLKSPIFKYNNTMTSRTPSKSPIKPGVSPGDLFQKVCCPNCKYGFKIIRQQVMKENPAEKVIVPSKKNKIRLFKEIETQTEGILTMSNNNSPTKSIVSQHRFSKTYDFSVGQESKGYELSQLNQMMEQENIENRQMRDSSFKFKPLSLSPHSKFSKSKNLLKTLDSKEFQVLQSQPKIKSPPKTAEYINPYYVHKQQSPLRKEENLYQQTLPFREEDKLYNNGNREYVYGGSIEREPIGYNNGRGYNDGRGGEGGMASPHASSEKLQENHPRSRGMSKLDPIQTPNTSFSKRPNEQKQKQENNMQRRTNQPQQNYHNQKSQTNNNNRQQSQYQQSSYPGTDHMLPSKKYSPQFQQLITQIVLKSQQQQHVIRELQEICRIVSDEVELPSFCKMLALIQ